MVDVGEVAGAVVPFLSAAAGAYGSAVVQRVADQAGDASADATVGFGRRLLRRLLGSSRSEQVGDAVTELGERPDDDTTANVVRAQVHRALAEDPELAAEIAGLLAEAGADVDAGKFTVTVTGGQGVQVGDHNAQTNTFGGRPR